jgi:hypothetical protein
VASDDDPFRPLGPVTPAVPLRVPRAGRSGIETMLADANDRARRRSLDRLRTSLPGIDVAELAQRADGADVAVGSWAGTGSVLEQPLDPADALMAALDALAAEPLIDAQLVDGDDVRPLDDGGPLRRPAAVLDALDRGWTLELGPHPRVHPGLPDLLDDLSRAFAAPVSTMVEVATTSSRGRAPSVRADDHLAIQLVGSQERFVRRPMALSPHPLVPELGATTPGPEVDCVPGTARWLPRGWCELRLGREEISIAVELAIARPTLIDVLHELADLAAAQPMLRADVPYDAERAHGSYAGSVMADPNLWTAEFGGLVEWPAFDRALGSLRARVPVRPDSPTRRPADDRANRVPGGVMIGPVADDHAVVAAGGLVASVSITSIVPLSEALAPTAESADERSGSSDRAGLLASLVRHGWIGEPVAG